MKYIMPRICSSGMKHIWFSIFKDRFEKKTSYTQGCNGDQKSDSSSFLLHPVAVGAGSTRHSAFREERSWWKQAAVKICPRWAAKIKGREGNKEDRFSSSQPGKGNKSAVAHILPSFTSYPVAVGTKRCFIRIRLLFLHINPVDHLRD